MQTLETMPTFIQIVEERGWRACLFMNEGTLTWRFSSNDGDTSFLMEFSPNFQGTVLKFRAEADRRA